MMISAFDGSVLKQRLLGLTSDQQLAFGAACCERLLPNYLAFQQDTDHGNVAPLRTALDRIWGYLCCEPLSRAEITDLIKSCEEVVPSSEDYFSLYVTCAQDACFAVCSLLDYLLEHDVEKIVEVATFATDSVDLYVQEVEMLEPNDPRLEEKILLHRLMQKELMKQEDDLNTILAASSLKRDFLDQLRSTSSNKGKGNLDLPNLDNDKQR